MNSGRQETAAVGLGRSFVPRARLRIRGPLPSPIGLLRGVDLERPKPSGQPDLHYFDLIVVSTSGGKAVQERVAEIIGRSPSAGESGDASDAPAE